MNNDTSMIGSVTRDLAVFVNTPDTAFRNALFQQYGLGLKRPQTG
jgi:hypothetical protein